MVWEYAFPSDADSRIACLHVQSAPSTRLSHEVLNLGYKDATIGWEILNPMYLAQTDPVSSLLTTSDRSRSVTLSRVQKTLDTPWLRRLGLSGAHLNPETDIVCFGNPLDGTGSNRFMSGLSLVLGNEFPNIMVPAQPFERYIQRELRFGDVDPVRAALAGLKAVDPVWDRLFSDLGGPLASPGTPRNIYYFMANPRRAPRCEHYSGSFCLHPDHLRIVNWDQSLDWAMSYTSDSRPDYMRRRHERLDTITTIKFFWISVWALRDYSGRIPNIYFVEIKE